MSDEDFTRLSLQQRLDHKLWKARLNAYQELEQKFKGGKGEEHWKRPELFGKYLTESNVVAHEQVIASLESFLREVEMPSRGVDLKSVFEVWIPALAEKGLSSSRITTREKANECIILLCSLDQSITRSVELILPFCEKKMPKLIANSLHSIGDLLRSFGLINCNSQVLLPQLLEPLVKLAGHADKNVRSETIRLVVEIYKCTGKKTAFLQELLLDQLKPIQQKELDRLFTQADLEGPQNDKMRLFVWQRREKENSAKDQDGDTIMETQPMGSQRTSMVGTGGRPASYAPIDPLDLLPEQTLLDKLPENFSSRIASSKWKDRVESLQEFHDNGLGRCKKLNVNKEDYSEILSVLGRMIYKDANVQAVSLAAQCVCDICHKIKNGKFNKQYIGLVFTPLLERTKEKKKTVIETIRSALQALCKQQYPLASHGHNEDMLEEILNFMKHKTPQVRQESTFIFIFNLLQIPQQGNSSSGSRKIVQKYLSDEICPTIIKIVNDTQPTVRECGFECLAVMLKILGRKDLDFMLEQLDNLKGKKIQEHLDKLPEFELPKESVNPMVGSATTRAPPKSPTEASTIPSKRRPSSPLKKSNSSSVPKSRVLLTSRALGSPPANNSLQAAATTTSPKRLSQSQINTELTQLQRDKSEWIQERHQLLSQVNRLSNSQSQLIKENESLREQLKLQQTDIHENALKLRSKDLQLIKLQDRIVQLERDLKERQILPSEPASAISTNLGVRSISSSSMDPMSANWNPPSNKPKHLRSPSDSSDDLPRRVDSLQLSNNQPGTGIVNSITTTTAVSSSSSDAINEESWKRAAEVTSQLKARIERMRAKTRGIK